MNAYDFTGISESNKIKGWFSLEKAIAIQQVVKQILSDSKVVEQRSFQDRQATVHASVLPADSVLYCVARIKGAPEHQTIKLDLTKLLEAFTKNLEEFGGKDNISPLAMSTASAAEKFEPEAARASDSVKLDLWQWYPKLKSGGFLFGDESAPNWPGALRAMNAFALEGQLTAPALWCDRFLAGDMK